LSHARTPTEKFTSRTTGTTDYPLAKSPKKQFVEVYFDNMAL